MLPKAAGARGFAPKPHIAAGKAYHSLFRNPVFPECEDMRQMGCVNDFGNGP